MAKVRFTKAAEQDLEVIADYTVAQWGLEQCDRYLDALEASCQQLGVNPSLGRSCDSIRPGYRRIEHGKHVIFYRIEKAGVVIVRLLHAQMVPTLHLTPKDDE